MNDFILKACAKELLNFGFSDFEHISFKHDHLDYFIYYFRAKFDNNFVYFNYHAEKDKKFNFEADIKSQIDAILDMHHNSLYYINIPNAFILTQLLSKLSFDNKRVFNYDSTKFSRFVNQCSFNYKNSREFVGDLDNIDLIKELGAY